ncbi:MAG: DUF362 domain-containing protein [Deltaproteobacteria bacterium]|nr:MAG: DUF362 domain-containing protein [Deltaproteobacteria bacterium]
MTNKTAKVLLHDASASPKKNRLDKLRSLFERAGFGRLISAGDRVAVKVHWGEPGNVGYLHPPYARTVVEMVRDAGGKPFVTDTNTLYVGMRRDAVDNLRAAALDGYTAETLGAPIIVADGLCGNDWRGVDVPDSLVGQAKIAAAIADADAMIVLTHVKSHMLFGFGGALKNLGMGCATPAGKQVLHSDLRPRVEPDKCHGDRICVRRCPERCIDMVDHNGRQVARIDQERCVGCGECTAACPHEAIPINWTTSPDRIFRKTAEYAWAAVQGKEGKVGYLNMMVTINPDCDCCDWNDVPFAPDLGMAASVDPVAIDAACMDILARAPAVPGSKAAGRDAADTIRAVYDVDYRQILGFAEKLGLGTSDYRLVKLA